MPEVTGFYGSQQQGYGQVGILHRSLMPYLLMAAILFALGATLGSLAVGRMADTQLEQLNAFIFEFVKNLSSINIDPQAAARSAMMENITTIILIYFLGLTVIGIPLTIAIVFMRGFILGFSVGFLCRGLNGGGILLSLVSMLPQNIFYVPALLAAAAASLFFSTVLLQRFFNSKYRIMPGFIKYTATMGAVALVAVAAALVQAYFTPWLALRASGLIMNFYSGQ